MIKQTLYFGNPTYIKVKNKQLDFHIKTLVNEKKVTRSIEDIGVVVLDNSQITITHNAIKALQANKVAIISCGDGHMPESVMLPLEGHTEQSKRFRYQVEASVPLKKNLWTQTVIAKVENQKTVLSILEKPTNRLTVLLNRIQSGDPQNIEGQAAAYYWSQYLDGFIRDRVGDPPNNLLNYGYAILRSMIARSLVSSGLMPTLGIHHKNKYNAYCLADDIMEPYRPFIDLIAYDMYMNGGHTTFLSTSAKSQLLSIAKKDALFGKSKRPLMVGMSFTTSSLAKCFMGSSRKIVYPKLMEL